MENFQQVLSSYHWDYVQRNCYASLFRYLVFAGLVLNIFLALLPMLLRFMTTQQVDLPLPSNKFRYAGCSTQHILSYHSCTKRCGEALTNVNSSGHLRNNLPSQWMCCEVLTVSMSQHWKGPGENVKDLFVIFVVAEFHKYIALLQGMISNTQVDFGVNRKYYIFLVSLYSDNSVMFPMEVLLVAQFLANCHLTNFPNNHN